MANVNMVKRVTGRAHNAQFVEGTDTAVIDSIGRSAAGASSLFNEANTSSLTVGGSALTTLTLATGAAVTTVNIATGTGAADTIAIGGAGSTTTFAGDVTISGSTTTVSTTNMVISDALIMISDGAGTGVDSGIAIERGATGNDAVILWEEGADRFELGLADTTGGTVVPASIANAAFVDLKVNDLLLDGTAVTADGALTVTATAAVLSLDGTTLETSGTSLTSDGAFGLIATGALSLGAAAATTGVNIATDANAKTVTIGNNTGASAIALEAGTGGVDIDADGASTWAFDGDLTVSQDAEAAASGAVGHTVTWTGGTGGTGAAGVSPTAAGAGGAWSLTGGTGGAGIATTTLSETGSDAGAGSAMSITGGTGGLAAGRDGADGDFASGGAGGAITLTSGTGGAGDSTDTASGAAGDAGVGGAFTIAGGTGGAGSDGTVDDADAGAGGLLTLRGGTGGLGAGIGADGSGGGLALQGGAAGGGGAATGTDGTITIGNTNTASVTVLGGTNAGTLALGNSSAGAVTLDTAAGFSIDGATASNVTVAGAAADLTLGARGTTITLNEAGDTSLDGSFTAVSILGALNELKTSGVNEARNIVSIYTTTGLTAGAPVFISSNDTVSHADADAAGTSDVIGLVKTVAGAGSGEVATRGTVTAVFAAGDTGFAAGDTVFLSTTVGRCTFTAPVGAGDTVLELGYLKDATGLSATTVDGETAEIELILGPRTVV